MASWASAAQPVGNTLPLLPPPVATADPDQADYTAADHRCDQVLAAQDDHVPDPDDPADQGDDPRHQQGQTADSADAFDLGHVTADGAAVPALVFALGPEPVTAAGAVAPALALGPEHVTAAEPAEHAEQDHQAGCYCAYACYGRALGLSSTSLLCGGHLAREAVNGAGDEGRWVADADAAVGAIHADCQSCWQCPEGCSREPQEPADLTFQAQLHAHHCRNGVDDSTHFPYVAGCQTGADYLHDD